MIIYLFPGEALGSLVFLREDLNRTKGRVRQFSTISLQRGTIIQYCSSKYIVNVNVSSLLFIVQNITFPTMIYLYKQICEENTKVEGQISSQIISKTCINQLFPPTFHHLRYIVMLVCLQLRLKRCHSTLCRLTQGPELVCVPQDLMESDQKTPHSDYSYFNSWAYKTKQKKIVREI